MVERPDIASDRRTPPSRKRPLLALFAAAGAVALVLLSVFALNLGLGRLKDSFGWVEHPDEVLLQLTRIEATLAGGGRRCPGTRV